MSRTVTKLTGPGARRWGLRLAVLALFVIAGLCLYISNRLLTERFTETTRNRAELRMALYSAQPAERTSAKLRRATASGP